MPKTFVKFDAIITVSVKFLTHSLLVGNGICLAMYHKGGGAASGLPDVIGNFSEEVELWLVFSDWC